MGATLSCRHGWLADLTAGALAFAVTSAPVWLGVTYGIDFAPLGPGPPQVPPPVFLTACSRFDGRHYAAIVEHGYSFDPGKPSTVAFFPVFPCAARLLVMVTGWDARLSLLVVSNLMLFGAFIVFAAYLRLRCPEAPSSSRSLVLAMFGLCPAGFFFRMTYSESTFLLFMLLVMCGIARRWPLLLLALLTGLVTAVRPVGLALTIAFVAHILSDTSRGPIVRRSLLAIVCFPIACWGLLAYMGYQYHVFGTPLAFAQTQEHWGYAAASRPWDKIESLLAAEPIWGVYTSDPVRNWNRLDRHGSPFFSLSFWNPLIFIGAFALVLFGAYKCWLSRPEIVLGLGLLGIPYVTRAYEMSMASHARFAAIVIPAYVVLGRMLSAQAEWLTWSVVGMFAVLLMAWSALFAAGHLLF